MTCRLLSRLLKVDSQIFVAIDIVGSTFCFVSFSVFFWPDFGQILTNFTILPEQAWIMRQGCLWCEREICKDYRDYGDLGSDMFYLLPSCESASCCLTKEMGKKAFVRIHDLLEKNSFCPNVETCTVALFKLHLKFPIPLPSHIKAVLLPQLPEFFSLHQSAAPLCSCTQSYQLNFPCFDCFCFCFLCFDPGEFGISTFGLSLLHQTSLKICVLVLQSGLNSSSSINDTNLAQIKGQDLESG